MSRRIRIAVLGMTVALSVTLASPSAMAQGMAIQRPISDWLAAQGSMTAEEWANLLQMPFIVNYVTWSGRTGPHDAITLLMVVDYAGLDAEAEISGRVIERPLSGGRTEVHVTLHTRNALTSVLNFTGSPPVFGATLFEGLGDSLLEAVYVVPRAPGAPMEDLVQVVFTTPPDWSFVKFFAMASGEFTAASEFGEGTPGSASTQQAGLLGPALRNGFRGALGDAFPAEWIDLHVTGN
jgi:hypothetical protein